MESKIPDYGNWVPKKFLIFFSSVSILFFGLSFIPLYLPFKIIFWALSFIFLVIFLFFLSCYILFSQNNNKIQNNSRELVLQKLPEKLSGKMIDIGTGNGPLAIALAKKYFNSEIIAIDYWGKGWDYSIEVCKKNAAIEGVSSKVSFIKATASNLPFGDGKFDVAVSNFVFHEVDDIKDKRKVIKEALRVVKKGGYFSFQDLFLNKRTYGEIGNLIKTIRSWGIDHVYFTKTMDIIDTPFLLKNEIMLGKAGILYGKK